MPAGAHVAPHSAILSPSMSSIHGMPPTLHHKRPFHVGLSSGHDSLTVEAINRLWNRLQTKSSHVLEMQPPLGANHDPPMQWRCIGEPAGTLTPSPGAQGSSTAYKYYPSSLML